MTDRFSRHELVDALDDIVESPTAWESLQQALVRLARGDDSAVDRIRDLLKGKVRFRREHEERYPEHHFEADGMWKSAGG